MQVIANAVEMNPIGNIKPKYQNSPIVAFYLDKDAGYGFYMHENGNFQYFSFDNNAQYWQKAIDDKNQIVQEGFLNKPAIISWHYNYQKRSLTFIDEEFKVWVLVVTENLIFIEDSKLNDALGQ